MKRIGILTFHKYYNYGTALQAYALQQFVDKNFDCETELIDYIPRNDFVGKKLLLTRIKRLGTYLKEFSKCYTLYMNRRNQSKKVSAFNEFFKKFMVFSEERADCIENLTTVCEKYDAVMVGSDQTWNPFVAANGAFLLDYFDGQKVAKLTYAPSIGISKIPDEWIPRFKNALSDFKALSCRERAGAAFFSELLDQEVSFVVDPTLLLTPADWEKITTPEEVDEPYLLTYFLGDNKSHRKAVERIAAEKNLKIVSLPVSYLEIKSKKIDRRYVGPGGFISLIKNASFVCTDSFHGTMFSINFGRDFMSFPKRDDADANSDNSRLYDALKIFGLEERLGICGKFTTECIDYSSVNKKLAQLRKSSKDYLQKAIKFV